MSSTGFADDLQRRPLLRSEYEALGQQGFFDDEKVELLDGQIVYAADEGPPHAEVCSRLNRILVESIPAGEGTVRVGNPFALSDLSEPAPDFLVARRPTVRGTRQRPRWLSRSPRSAADATSG